MISTTEVEPGTSVAIYPVADLVENNDDGQSYETLMNAITAHVSPDSWTENGGSCGMAPLTGRGVFVVLQSQETHDELDAFLTQLRTAKQAEQQAVGSVKSERKLENNANGYSVRTYIVEGDAAVEKLIPLVKGLVEPDSWNQPNAFAETIGDRLLIRQRVSVHRAVEKFLKESGMGYRYIPDRLDASKNQGGLGGGLMGGGGLF